MAIQSVIAAVMARYDALPGVPPVFFAQAALHKPGDGQTAAYPLPPFAILTDGGTTPTSTFEFDLRESTRLEFTIYGRTLAEADLAAFAVRFGGGPRTGTAGMDHADSLPLPNATLLAMVCASHRRGLDRNRTDAGTPVYTVTLTYDVLVHWAA